MSEPRLGNVRVAMTADCRLTLANGGTEAVFPEVSPHIAYFLLHIGILCRCEWIPDGCLVYSN
jgi:hypothetical protein